MKTELAILEIKDCCLTTFDKLATALGTMIAGEPGEYMKKRGSAVAFHDLQSIPFVEIKDFFKPLSNTY